MVSPADHVRMLVDILRPMGAELTRRWVAALLRVPPEDRLEVVEAVERRVAEVYDDIGTPRRAVVARAPGKGGTGRSAPTGDERAGDGHADERTRARAGAGGGAGGTEPDGARLVDVILPPEQRAGYVEQQVVTYEELPSRQAQAERQAQPERKRKAK